MNPSAISAFHQRAAAEIADTLGTKITIGGNTFFAHVTTPQPTMSLETGGFNTDRAIKVRWPAGRAPKPAVGDALLLVSENLSFRVETATSLVGSTLGSEIHVTAIRE